MKYALAVLAGIVFSNELVEEIYRNLASQPYSIAAPLITKMQNEAAHQPPPQPPPSIPPEPK